MQVGVRLEAPEHAASALLYSPVRPRTSPRCRRAAALGLRLAADGLHTGDGARHPAATEADIYAALGLPLIPAEVRNGDDEIAAALAGTLPVFVSRQDMRGDLHMHTMWSDGRDSIAAMVETCRALGYEYWRSPTTRRTPRRAT